MAFKVGQYVLQLTSTINPEDSKIERHKITKVSKEYVWVDNNHRPEDCFYPAFLYPDTPESCAHIHAIRDMRIRHKLESDKMQAATYQLLNKQTLNGER